MRYLPHTPEDMAAMLEAVGTEHMDALFHDSGWVSPRDTLNLPEPLTEWELDEHMVALSKRSETNPFTALHPRRLWVRAVTSILFPSPSAIFGAIGILHRLYPLSAGNEPGDPCRPSMSTRR
jgi:hypothetical protein